MRFGMPVPDRIANAPDLDMGLGLYYQGFLDLTSCRQIGMGIGPISLLSVLEYCVINGIEGEQREDFVWLVTHLDAKYLEWSRGRQHAGRIQSPNGENRPGNPAKR
ncbi:tail chaperonin [Stenotrophomonas phage vB_SmaS_Bhz59]